SLMPAPGPEKVLQALEAVIALGKSAGVPQAVEELERHRTLFLDRKPTLKQLQGPVKDATDRAFHALRAVLIDAGLRDPLPGKEALTEEFYRVFGGLNRIIYPPRFVAKELD